MFSPIDLPVYVYCGVSDMRLGIDRLVGIIKEFNPLRGGYFVFFSRKRERVRIMYWNEDGYAIWLKRLEAGSYKVTIAEGTETITAIDLKSLLSGTELTRIKYRRDVEKRIDGLR